MRSLHKSWQDKRPGWTRRVRWYEAHGHVAELGIDIRLNLVDEDGMLNLYYHDRLSAQLDYDRFANGMPVSVVAVMGDSVSARAARERGMARER